MCERRPNGGRKGKEDRNSEDEEEARDSHENTMNTGVTSTENQNFISITIDFFRYKFFFYRNKRAVMGRRRIVAVREVIKGLWLTGLTHLRVLQYSLHEMTRQTTDDGDSDFKSQILEISLSRILECAKKSQCGNPFGPRPRGRWAVSCRGELDNQPDGLDHGLNLVKSSIHSS